MRTIVAAAACVLALGCGDDKATGIQGVCYTDVTVGNECTITQYFDDGSLAIDYKIDKRNSAGSHSTYTMIGKVTNHSDRSLRGARLRAKTSADANWLTVVSLGEVLSGGDYVPFVLTLPDTGWPLFSVTYD